MNSLRELCATRRYWLPGRFAPIATSQIDLASPDAPLLPDGLTHALLRLGDAPIGEVLIEPATAPRPSGVVEPLLVAHERRITEELARRALARHPASPSPAIDVLLEPDEPPAGAHPLVTVAICTRDRAEGLRRTLAAVLAQDYPSLDVLVVDNAPSDDAAANVVRDAAGVRRVLEPRPGLDRARSRAVREARGEIIAFTDDDARPERQWVSALVRAFAGAPEAAVVTGLVLPASLGTPAQLLFESYGGFSRGFVRRWWHHPDRSRPLTSMPLKNTGRFGTGANMAFRTSFLRTGGGFDPALDVGTAALGGGDLEMFFRAVKEGHALLYEPAAIVRHEHRVEYGELLQQLEQWGSGMAAFIASASRRYPDERAGFDRFEAYMLGAWFFRRLAASWVRPAFPSEMILRELHGRRLGADRYAEARRALEPDEGIPVANNPRTSHATLAAARQYTVDVLHPPAPLDGAERVRRVELRIRRGNRELGTATIENGGQPVGSERLREAVARAAPYAVLGVSPTELRQALSRRLGGVRARSAPALRG